MPILKVTSLGWVKCYAPTVQLPQPADCPFEDFVFMAALLNAHRITALPADYMPIEYLRRSTSVCGQRKAQHFTHDIPLQLKTFFDAVYELNKNGDGYKQKVQMARDFVEAKLAQYENLLPTLIKTGDYPEITNEILVAYQEAAIETKTGIQKQ